LLRNGNFLIFWNYRNNTLIFRSIPPLFRNNAQRKNRVRFPVGSPLLFSANEIKPFTKVSKYFKSPIRNDCRNKYANNAHKLTPLFFLFFSRDRFEFFSIG
jgi:hypothetical protein